MSMYTYIYLLIFSTFIYNITHMSSPVSARFCRSISLSARLDLFLRLVVAHCEMGNPYVPPAPVEKLEAKPRPPVELVRAPVGVTRCYTTIYTYSSSI